MSALAAVAPAAESYLELLQSGSHWLFELTLEIATAPIALVVGWVWRGRLLRHVHRDLGFLHRHRAHDHAPADEELTGRLGAAEPSGPMRLVPPIPDKVEVRPVIAHVAPRVPVTFFAIPFGLAGLAGPWSYASQAGWAPVAFGTGLLATAGLLWAVLVVIYVNHAFRNPTTVREDLDNATTAPFTALWLLTPMLVIPGLAGPRAPDSARVAFDTAVLVSVLLAAWITGRLVAQPTPLDRIHPGYLLPSVAGGYVAAIGAAFLGQVLLAQAMFGLASASWIVLGPLVFLRLVNGPALSAALTPTLAIQVAPAAVASLAWFALNGGHLDPVAVGLAGYGLLMLLAQLALLPIYRRLTFAPGFWAFTFPTAAFAAATLHWISLARPTGTALLAYLVLGTVTIFVGAIAFQTVRALRRHEALAPAGRSNIDHADTSNPQREVKCPTAPQRDPARDTPNGAPPVGLTAAVSNGPYSYSTKRA